jgi:hypothetical protein
MFYDSMYFAVVIAHEVGHQFGLSPRDRWADITGLGVMATHEYFGSQLANLERQLTEAAMRAKEAGRELTPEEKTATWLGIFNFQGYDRLWIYHGQ